jgi:hypothetical protein
MTRWSILLLAALCLAALGCGGSDKDRAIYSNKDKPRSTSAE